MRRSWNTPREPSLPALPQESGRMRKLRQRLSRMIEASGQDSLRIGDITVPKDAVASDQVFAAWYKESFGEQWEMYHRKVAEHGLDRSALCAQGPDVSVEKLLCTTRGDIEKLLPLLRGKEEIVVLRARLPQSKEKGGGMQDFTETIPVPTLIQKWHMMRTVTRMRILDSLRASSADAHDVH